MGHFVSSPREREKREKKDSRGDEKGTGKEEGIPLYPYLLQE